MNELALLFGIWAGWLASGLITMRLASSKGRTDLAWFLIAFATGPVGIILILIQNAKPLGPWNNQIQRQNLDELSEMKRKRDSGLISHLEYDEAKGRLIEKF